MSEEAFEYINERLFTEEKPVLFTDLIFRFKIGPSKAKQLMYSYYRQNTSTKFNCIIICVDEHGNIKVVYDLNSFDDQQTLVDCFIYAFNPLEVFTPVSVARDMQEVLPVRNCYELKVEPKRAKTLDAQPKVERTAVPPARSRTVPETKEPAKKPATKGKETGLRSTAILAKMRGERERKERERREELQKRRDEELQRATKNDPKRSAQMEELNSLFDGDEDDEQMTDGEPIADRSSPEREESMPIDKQELEELLETTAEDSLMHTRNEEPVRDAAETKPGPDSSYVDEDGYIVTNRAATSTPPPRRPAPKRPHPAPQPEIPKKTRLPKTKKSQPTLENFFKKR